MDYSDLLRAALKSGDTEGLISALKDASDSEADLAEVVVPFKKDALALLFKALGKEAAHDRAVILLSEICTGDMGALLEVCGLLKSGDKALYAGGAAVLSRVCPRSPEARSALPPWVLESLISTLKGKTVKEGFVDRRRWSRVRAVEALGAIGDAKAIPVLVSALDDEDAMIVLRARYALAGMKDKEAVAGELGRVLSSETHIVPLVGALWVVEKVALAAPSGRPEFSLLIPVLAGLLAKNDDAEVQMRAANAMVSIDEKQAVREIAALLGKDFGKRDGGVKRTAASALVRLAEAGYPAAREELKRLVAREGKLPEGKRAACYEEAKLALDAIKSKEEDE